MTKKQKQQPVSQGQEFIGLIAGLFGGYFIAEVTLAQFAHPYHWLVAAVAAVGGYYGVLAWFKLHISSRLRRNKAVAPQTSRKRG